MKVNRQQQFKLKSWLDGPFLTQIFLVIQSIVFFAMEVLPGNSVAFGLGMSGQHIAYLHEWWRLITPIFIHFGMMHFVLNSVVLYFMGSQIETVYGHWRFFLIYLLSGIMGNVTSFAFNEMNVLSGGASTSLFGLFGALFVLGIHYKNDNVVKQLVRRYMIFIVFSFIFGISDTSVDIWGHVGGLIGGFLIGNLLGLPNRSNDYSIHHRIISSIVFLFLFIICVLVGLKNYGILV